MSETKTPLATLLDQDRKLLTDIEKKATNLADFLRQAKSLSVPTGVIPKAIIPPVIPKTVIPKAVLPKVKEGEAETLFPLYDFTLFGLLDPSFVVDSHDHSLLDYMYGYFPDKN